MEQYKKSIQLLLTYLPYFVKNKQPIGHLVNNSYYEYDKFFEKFIHDVYQSGLLIENYLETLAFYESYHNNYCKLIKIADFTTLRAILTGYIEQEKNHEGLWLSACKQRTFLSILLRLKELSNQY
ncbi:MAG: hypothetical protein KAG94_06145 [Clostridiales bacterium]|nr:hypothetical protein [Clostridiales bacterium]